MSNKITAEVNIELKAPMAVVWKAITDPEEVKKYFFGTQLVTDWLVGHPIYFRGEWEGQPYEDKGIVLQFVPQKILQYDYWSSFSQKEDIPENYQTITYEVADKGDHILLRITQTKIDSEEQKEHSEQNWNMVLGELKKLVEN